MREKLPGWAIKAQEKLNVKGAIPWSTGEVHAPCPQCGGKDRLIIWETGGSYCRQCHYKKPWKNVTGRPGAWSNEKKRKAERAAFEMSRSSDWVAYHYACRSDPNAMRLWKSEGFDEESVARWGLGYAEFCPIYRDSPTLTIPVFGAGRLLDIRHKLLKTTPLSGKYRSHVAGVAMIVNLFNRDSLRVPQCIIIEGEKKTMTFEDHGFAACGVYGSGGTKELVSISKKIPLNVIVALDPDVEEQAWNLCSQLAESGAKVSFASFPLKPDDFIIRYGIDLTNEVLRQAIKVLK